LWPTAPVAQDARVSKKIFVTVAAVAAVVFTATAQAGVIIGSQAVEPKADYNPAGTPEAFRFAATGTGQLASASVYVDTGSTATTVAIGVYTENATGHPGTLLSQGTLTGPVAAAWNVVPLAAGTSLSAGTNYWIALLGTGGTLRFRDRCCSGGTPAEVPAQVNVSTLPATWSTGARYNDGPAAIYGSSVDGPVLAVTPTSLSFSGLEGGAPPVGQSFSISNAGGGLLSWNVTTNASWLTASPASGVDSGSVFVTTSTAGLVAGTYSGTVTVTAAGASGAPQSLQVTLTVTRPDTAAPTVSITSPSSGATLSGTVTVSATAADDVGVRGVQFKLDGANLGAEDPTAPYGATWDTTSAASGSHVLTAVARDAAGNSTTSTGVTVSVTNTAPLPAAYLVGDQAIESATDSNPAGVAEAFKFTAVASGTLSALSAYIDVLSTATSVTVGVYSDVGGHPGALLTQGTRAGPVAGTWNDVAVTSVSLASGTTYWIAILGTGGVAKFRDRCCGNGSPVEASAQTSLTALPATWSTGASYKDGPVSIWGKGSVTGGGPPPSQVGEWSNTIAWPSVAVHMSLLPTGNVLSWDGFAAAPNSERLWNPLTGAFTPVPFGTNLFCAGHVLLPDGRQLVVGGHVAAAVGLPDTSIFDPKTNTWSSAARMSVARWYPTATLLGDGRVFVMGGDNLVEHQSGVPHAFYDSSVPTLPEVYDPVTNVWTGLTGARLNSPWYPFIFQLTDGRVLDAGPDTVTRTITPGVWTWQNLNTDSPFDGMSAVMYRPDKVMKSGAWADPDFKGSLLYAAHARTGVLDMTQPAPSWRETAPMSYARSYQNLTLLPDGTVFTSGGMATSDGVDLSQAVLPTEIWDPATEKWATTASMSVGREYHSTALLLPDGRVLMAGGGQLPGSPATDQYNAQIFSPPYLFKGARPAISSTPSLVQYGSTFQVTTPDAASVASVSLIRTPSVTHDFDQNQRFSFLSFSQGNGVLNVQAPVNGNAAPPGYYMLFIVNTNGVPSVASFVRFPAPYEDTVAPSAPGTVSATGAIGRVSLSWGAATDNAVLDHYDVYRSTTAGFTPSAVNRIATPTAASYVDGGLAAGTYYYRVKAVDRAGNIGPASNEASGAATADTTPPTVSVSAPPAGATVSGVISLSAVAGDNVGVAGVQFKVDGASVGSEATASPYGALWDSTGASNAPHTVTAVARDAAGNTAISAPISVTVSNAAPPVLAVLLGDQAVEPKIDGNVGGSAEAFSTTATVAGSVKQLTFYVDGSSTATSIIVGLYTDNNNHPGTLLTSGVVSAPTANAWNTVAVPAAGVTAAGKYWIALLSPNGAGGVKFRNRCCGGGTPAEMAASTTLGALPAAWTSGASYKDGPLSAYGSG
jgi:hypothetical protein